MRFREEQRDWPRGGSLVRCAPQRAGIVHRVHAVLAVFVIDECKAIGLPGPRQHRRERRDPLDAGEHVGQLVDLLVVEFVQEHIGDAGPIRDERQGAPVRRPRRIDILADIHVLQDLDPVGVEVIQRDAQIAEPQQIEIGRRTAIRDERDQVAIRRPRRVQVGVLVGGEPQQPAAVAVDDVEIGKAVREAGEDELRAVG